MRNLNSGDMKISIIERLESYKSQKIEDQFYILKKTAQQSKLNTS